MKLKFSVRSLLVVTACCALFFAVLNNSTQPILDGVVVRTKADLFAVKLGSDDGIRNGLVLGIYRENCLVGKGVVADTQHDLSVLRVIKGSMKGLVNEGDHAKTMTWWDSFFHSMY